MVLSFLYKLFSSNLNHEFFSVESVLVEYINNPTDSIILPNPIPDHGINPEPRKSIKEAAPQEEKSITG